jgi:hypothetical protein
MSGYFDDDSMFRRIHRERAVALSGRIREQYGFSALPPVVMRKALVAGGADYIKRAVIPFLPGRLRLVPGARAA